MLHYWSVLTVVMLNGTLFVSVNSSAVKRQDNSSDVGTLLVNINSTDVNCYTIGQYEQYCRLITV